MTAPLPPDAVTFEVAGLACRIECAHAKPILWVTELHPGFAVSCAADLVVTVRYDDGYWTHDLPWIAPDQLADVPVHVAGDGVAIIRSAYYEAQLDADRSRALVRIAGGFFPTGALRALYAMLLPRRGACLVRATIHPAGSGAVLACGSTDDGIVALVDHGTHVEVEATPFHPGITPTRPPPRRVDAIDVGEVRDRGEAAARVLQQVVVVDHSPATLERVLDVVTRLAASVPLGGDVAAEREASAAR